MTETVVAKRHRTRGIALSEDHLEYIRAAFARKEPTAEVAEKLNCNKRTVEKWYWRLRKRFIEVRLGREPNHSPHYDTSRGPMCRYGVCQQPGTGSPPLCAYHKPVPKPPSIVLPWEVSMERKMGAR